MPTTTATHQGRRSQGTGGGGRVKVDPAKREAMYIEIKTDLAKEEARGSILRQPYRNVARKNIEGFYQTRSAASSWKTQSRSRNTVWLVWL